MRIFDTHAHYDSEQFDADRDALLGALTGLAGEAVGAGGRAGAGLAGDGAEAAGADEWETCCAVNVGAAFAGACASLELAHRYPGVYAACGVHPDEVGELEEAGGALFGRLEELCLDPKCVAVGEIGLDYHWMVQPKELQKKWFVRQLELSGRLHLPVNVHSRDAAADTFALIRDCHAGTGEGGIIHCYSGSVEMAREYVKMGYHIGIGGVVTFKNGRVLKEVVRELPLEWLVTETDCPYLAPEPFRGRRNDSGKIRYVIGEIARIRGMEVEETARVLFENALRVYRL